MNSRAGADDGFGNQVRTGGPVPSGKLIALLVEDDLACLVHEQDQIHELFQQAKSEDQMVFEVFWIAPAQELPGRNH